MLYHAHYSVCCIISIIVSSVASCPLFLMLHHFLLLFIVMVTSICEHSLIGYIDHKWYLECNLLHIYIPLGQEESIRLSLAYKSLLLSFTYFFSCICHILVANRQLFYKQGNCRDWVELFIHSFEGCFLSLRAQLSP